MTVSTKSVWPPLRTRIEDTLMAGAVAVCLALLVGSAVWGALR